LLNTMKLKPVIICYDWEAQQNYWYCFQSQFPHVKVISREITANKARESFIL
jgi:hypothetical protein